ncbi:hypothetical protein BJP37_29725 [Moorena bouillonii PNG]|uniref:Uncharacterized protein n=1 Tax=Moorena bouillonii PNG TaxID=568701 RepID=A0A1U7N9F9_9CYAN|nr:hypothetical protein BJP37_29725 [Moorena bouillonii PNG]
MRASKGARDCSRPWVAPFGKADAGCVRVAPVERASWWNGHLGGTGILVERASWWNGHLGGTGILVERASWWNRHLGGTGILVEQASWWNGHLARILPRGAVPIPDSRFPIPDSLLPTPYSLLPILEFVEIHQIIPCLKP